MKLRKHQQDFSDIIDRILQGEPINRIIGFITPGGGKSLLALLACRLIREGRADKICWVVPRLTLAYQAEMNFAEQLLPISKGMLIRATCNEENPCRGQAGYTTTYQSLAVDTRGVHAREFLKHRYILLIDENHHAADGDYSWANSLRPMVEHAAYTFFLSGTLSRGDENKIAFMPYIQKGNNTCLDLSPSEDTAIITYSRSDALKERAILPIKFTLFDGEVEWEKKGKEFKTKLSKAYKNSGDAIQTALNTEFGKHIMRKGLDHWQSYKQDHPRSKLAIVAANITHAKELQKIVHSWGIKALIATSDDSEEAIKAIKEFRYGTSDIMIFVMMCSEGLDIPSLTHIITLTHIRTEAWIVQLVARAVRVDKEAGPYSSQMAYVFAPDDPPFKRVVDQIKKEQSNIIIKDSEEVDQPKKKNNGGEREQGITFINGEISGYREISLGQIPEWYIPDTPPKTISEQESELRQKIEKHVCKFCFDNRHKPQRVNAEIKTRFAKARDLMTLSELKSCYKYVMEIYPIGGDRNYIQGISQARTKRRRVPTKAIPWTGI